MSSVVLLSGYDNDALVDYHDDRVSETGSGNANDLGSRSLGERNHHDSRRRPQSCVEEAWVSDGCDSCRDLRGNLGRRKILDRGRYVDNCVHHDQRACPVQPMHTAG